MNTRKSLLAIWILGCVWWNSAVFAVAQTVERDTTITGPRGRTLERKVEIQRGPGTIDRQIQIKRPGGTFDRQVQIQRTPGMVPGRIAGPWPRPAWFPRPVLIGAPAPAFGFGLLAAPMVNFSFGGGGGGPIGPMGGPPPGAMGPGGPAGPPPPPDQVALLTQRLQSFLSSHRKEAAYALGRLGDPRAVPSLIHVLKYDAYKDVRIAAAIGLGEIGGSESAIALERSSIYDHREDVRNASATALNRLNAKAKASPPTRARVDRPLTAPAPPEPSTSSPFRGYPSSGDAAPETPSSSPEPSTAQPEPARDQPPPPPTPVTAPPRGGPER